MRAHADLVLMDEKVGVRIAREQGLAVTGTLDVLVQAARRALVDMERALSEARFRRQQSVRAARVE